MYFNSYLYLFLKEGSLKLKYKGTFRVKRKIMFKTKYFKNRYTL